MGAAYSRVVNKAVGLTSPHPAARTLKSSMSTFPDHLGRGFGVVEPQLARFTEPLALACGHWLPEYELAYVTYGTLNDDASNALRSSWFCVIAATLSGEISVTPSSVPPLSISCRKR